MQMLALLAVAGAIATPASAHNGGTVFVTERQLGSLTAFDAATGRPIWTSPTGAAPIGVAQPHGTHKLYTSDEGANRISLFDARSGAPLGTIAMGPAPHHLMASRDGRRIYVGEFGRNTVGVVDTRTDAAAAHFVASPEPKARTHAVFITRDGRDLYAANTRAVRTEAGDVAHLDARTGALLCNTPVGVDPSEIIVAPNGRRGYVSVRGENTVKELDLRGRCPVLTGREAAVGPQPDTLQLSDDTLVVTLRGTPAQIALVDTRTFAVTPVSIAGHTTTGHHWLSGDGQLSFVAVENPGGLAVVDNETGTVMADYPYPGGSRPHGVFFSPRTIAVAARCGPRSVAVPTAPGGRRTLCARRFAPPRAPAARYAAAARLVRDQRLLPASARRLLRRARLRPQVSYRWLDRIALRALGPRAARRIERSTTLPAGSLPEGVKGTGKSWRVLPDDDEVGHGSGVEGEIALSGHQLPKELPAEFRERASLGTEGLWYEGRFAKHCPQDDGKVPGDYELHLRFGLDLELAGRRVASSVDMRLTARFVGDVRDDARLRDFDLTDGDAVIETKAREEVAGTGKLLRHHPTRVLRMRFSASGIDPRQVPSFWQLATNGRARVVISSPNDAEARAAVPKLFELASFAPTDVASVLLDAERHWYGPEQTADDFGACVTLGFDPNPVQLEPGASATVAARLTVNADGSETAARHAVRAFPQTGSAVAPETATSTPGAPARFTYQAPPQRSDISWASFRDIATSNRGRAGRTHVAENPPPPPRRYMGRVSGALDTAGGTETWAGDDVVFERSGGEQYLPVSGRLNWSLRGALGECTIRADATLDLAGDAYDLGAAPGGVLYVHRSGGTHTGGGAWAKRVQARVSCPDGFTYDMPWAPYSKWLDMGLGRGAEHQHLATGRLTGAFADPADPSGGSVRWEWDLGPAA